MSTPSHHHGLANRRIRVFISSTFRDMIGERDELMTHTWPALRRLCQERYVELVEVDLRWGIAESQSTRRETLKLCLDEIRACRPFFMGLLGERYGWTPGDDAFTDDLREEQPWLTGLRGKSVTEPEILHGVLNNPDMAGRAFFYFRDPVYAKGRGPDFVSETDDDAQKQTALKSRISTVCAEKKIPLREDYPDPRQLAAMVLADLTVAIETQFPNEYVPDPLTREAQDHQAFAEIRRRTYIGRADYFEALDRHASNDAGPLLLLGDSDHARLLGWLPGHPFSGPLRLIVSTLPATAATDDPLEAIKKRGWQELRVEPLTVPERRQMITGYLARFGKTLDEHRLDRIANAAPSANPLYLKILLDDLRVTGTYDRLDQRLTEYLAAADIPTLLQHVLARYQRDYERDRPGLVGEALGLICAARRRLSETELLQLLRPAGQAQLPSAHWTPLRAALEDALVDRGGILNFAHDFLRTAVETAFAPDIDRRDDLRLQLADYFEAQPISARSCDELPWLLRTAESFVRLRICARHYAAHAHRAA